MLMHNAQGPSDKPQQEFNINALLFALPIMFHGSLLPRGLRLLYLCEIGYIYKKIYDLHSFKFLDHYIGFIIQAVHKFVRKKTYNHTPSFP